MGTADARILHHLYSVEQATTDELIFEKTFGNVDEATLHLFCNITILRKDMKCGLERLPGEEASEHVLKYLPALFGLIDAWNQLEARDPKQADAFFSSRLSITWSCPLTGGKRHTSNSFHFEVVMALTTLASLYRSTAFSKLRLMFSGVSSSSPLESNVHLSPSSSSTLSSSSSPSSSSMITLDEGTIKSITGLLLSAAGIFEFVHTRALAGWRGDDNLAEHVSDTWKAFQELSHAEFMQVAVLQAQSKKAVSSLLAKLCSAISARYSLVVNHVETVQAKLKSTSVLRDLHEYATCSTRVYLALAVYYNAKDAGSQCGVAIARYRLALEHLTAAPIPTSKALHVAPLREFVNAYKAGIQAILQKLEYENEKVYYESVPASSHPSVAAIPEQRSIGTPLQFSPPESIHIPITITQSSGCTIQ